MVSTARDIKQAYFALHNGLTAYAGSLSPEEDKWLWEAVNEAVLIERKQQTEYDRMFGDPIKVAQALIEEKQSIPIIIASLIYSRIKKEQLSDDAFRHKLDDIEARYSTEIKNITRFALQVAYTDMPKRKPALEKLIASSEAKRKYHFEQIRREKKRNPDAVARPMHTVEEQQTAAYLRYMDSRNPVPQSQVIRVAERWVALKEIDPSTATEAQKKRIRESWLVHAQMANNHGLRKFYYDFGNLYIQTHFPDTYKAIEDSLDLLAKTLGQEGNPLGEVTEFLSRKLVEAGLECRDSLDNIQGGFYIKERLRKSVISIWTKLVSDGIDPEDYFKTHADEIRRDPQERLKILIKDVFAGHLYDLFACTVIVDEKALVRLGHIKEGDPKKVWHVHQEACRWVEGLLLDGVIRGGELRKQQYVPMVGRTKNYFRKPRGARQYRSLHVGIARMVAMPELGIRRLHLPVEVMLRTPLVHMEAEYGKWAHNRFKSELIRGEAAWQDAQKQASARTNVYLFTPDGEVLEFKKGTTIRDVAFSINQDLGLYCTGASAYSGYQTWRQDEFPNLRQLAPLTPDSLVDNIDGCSIIIEADVPQVVRQLREDGIKGYPTLPPGHTSKTLRALRDGSASTMTHRKVGAILRSLDLK